MSLFSLIFRLGTDNTAFNRGMNDAVGTANRSSRQMEDSFVRTSGNIKGYLLGALATVFGAQRIREATDYADKLQDISEQLSVSTTTLQEFEYVAGQTGTTLEGFTNTFRKLAQARREALEDPAGREAAAFQRLGVGIAALRDARLEDLLSLISVEFQRAGDSQQFFADAMILLGKSGQETFGAMKAGLAELREQAHEAGTVVSEETISRVARYADEWTLLGQKVKAMFTGLVGIVARLHQDMGDGIDRFGKFLSLAGRLAPWRSDRLTLREFEEERRNWRGAEFLKAQGPYFGQGHVPGRGGLTEDQIGAEQRRRDEHMARQEQLLEQDAAGKLKERAELLRVMRLTPGELVAELETKLAALQRGAMFKVEGPNFRDQLEMTETEIALENARRRMDKGRTNSRGNTSDSLLAVGNFLGSGPDRRLENEMRQSNRQLEEIKRLLERQAGNGVRFD